MYLSPKGKERGYKYFRKHIILLGAFKKILLFIFKCLETLFMTKEDQSMHSNSRRACLME